MKFSFKIFVYDCVVGYIGDDCALDVNLPPVITGSRIVGGCDVRGSNPCIFFSIFVIQFASIDTSSCKFVSIMQYGVSRTFIPLY